MMTDAQYWSIANGLPTIQLNGTFVLDWHSILQNCPPDPMSCNWVKGYNPVDNCWIDPGAQYVTRPNPYPAASSWGVSLCNPVYTGGGSTTGGGGTSSGGGSTGGGGTTGGGTTTQCPTGTILSGGKCVSTNAAPLPVLNMTYVVLGIAALGLLLLMRKP